MDKKQLTEYLRDKLKVPLGKVYNENRIEGLGLNRNLLITVGDTCSYTLIMRNVKPDIVVYDFKNMRMPVEEKIRVKLEAFCRSRISVNNPAGHITSDLVMAVRKMLELKHGCIFVDGEEDLAALVFMMYSPDNTYVLYGQPHEGIVVIKVDDEIRRLTTNYYSQMKSV